jgi:CheY-like chemotaxis protein
MMLQTLLVSADDLAARTLIEVLPQLGFAVTRSTAVDASIALLTEGHFDQVIVDFDAPEAASTVLESCRRLGGPDKDPPVMVALVPNAGQIRAVLGTGAHFALTKPVGAAQTQNTLVAASMLLKRTRRPASAAVQVPVALRRTDSTIVEGISLELNATGIELLAAQSLSPGTAVRLSFELPGDSSPVEVESRVSWNLANGQTGLRFLNLTDEIRQRLEKWPATHSQEAALEDPENICECKLTDLSLRGCYVKSESPFPQSSTVDLRLRADRMQIQIEGVVRVMHPGHGMGIELPQRTAEQRRSVGEFIDFLTNHRGIEPRLEASPRSLVPSLFGSSPGMADEHDAGDPLLELLRSGTALDENDFLAELQSQRTPATVSP